MYIYTGHMVITAAGARSSGSLLFSLTMTLV